MLALTNLLVQFSIFIALTAASLHHPAPIVEVNYVTTTTSQLLDANCHFKCYIAKRFLDGDLEHDHLWLYKNVPKRSMMKTMCAKEMCSKCAFCGEGEVDEGRRIGES